MAPTSPNTIGKNTKIDAWLLSVIAAGFVGGGSFLWDMRSTMHDQFSTMGKTLVVLEVRTERIDKTIDAILKDMRQRTTRDQVQSMIDKSMTPLLLEIGALKRDSDK